MNDRIFHCCKGRMAYAAASIVSGTCAVVRMNKYTVPKASVTEQLHKSECPVGWSKQLRMKPSGPWEHS